MLAASSLAPVTGCGSIQGEAQATFPGCAADQVHVQQRPDLMASADALDGTIVERRGCGRTSFATCTYEHGRHGARTGRVFCASFDDKVCSRTSLAECHQLCASGFGPACISIAAMYLPGGPLPPDREKARAVLVPACDSGELAACRAIQRTMNLELSDYDTANTVVCLRTDKPIESTQSCDLALRDRTKLAPALLRETLRRSCEVAGEHCGELKDAMP